MNQAEDAVQRFLGGDEGAFSQLVRQWEVKVYNLAWRFLGNREDAQDIAQETFLSVFRSIRQLRDPKSFPTWIYRITLNHCRAHWRGRNDVVSLDDPIPGDEGDFLEPVAARQECRDSLEVTDLLRKALAGISEPHRAAIILKEYVGLSLEEIASVMDCPLSTAKSRLYHGLRGVQQNLKRMGVTGLRTGS